jgi:hypothetical protein
MHLVCCIMLNSGLAHAQDLLCRSCAASTARQKPVMGPLQVEQRALSPSFFMLAKQATCFASLMNGVPNARYPTCTGPITDFTLAAQLQQTSGRGHYGILQCPQGSTVAVARRYSQGAHLPASSAKQGVCKAYSGRPCKLLFLHALFFLFKDSRK